MTAKWGVFLCTCHQTLHIDPHQLDLPTPYVQVASHPDTDIQAFATLAKREGFDRVLISCCEAPSLFEATLGTAGVEAPKIHWVNLKEPCFWIHPDSEQAHAKATRLLHAAVQTADTRVEPIYNPLSAGGRLLIATDTPLGHRLAAQLQDLARPLFVVPPEAAALDGTPPWRTYRGHVVEVKGRLGDFRVIIADDETPGHRELQADQVVLLSHNGPFPVKARTGCHLLLHPGEAEVDQLADRVRDLIGDFLKTVHVSYHTNVCAGGTASQEACGICIPACPYDAIRRDGQSPLRMHVDHMVSCARCGKPYINKKALEAIEARVLSLESLLDTFTGQRRTLLRICPDCRAVAAMLEVEKGWEPWGLAREGYEKHAVYLPVRKRTLCPV